MQPLKHIPACELDDSGVTLQRDEAVGRVARELRNVAFLEDGDTAFLAQDILSHNDVEALVACA